MDPVTSREQFVNYFPQIMEVLGRRAVLADLPDMRRWIERVVEYNVQGGKMNRGIALVESYKIMRPAASSDDVNVAIILGWAIELVGIQSLKTFVLSRIKSGFFIRNVTTSLWNDWYWKKSHRPIPRVTPMKDRTNVFLAAWSNWSIFVPVIVSLSWQSIWLFLLVLLRFHNLVWLDFQK